MNFDALETREVPLVPASAALLFIDVQNFSCRREGGEFTGAFGCGLSAALWLVHGANRGAKPWRT